MFIRLINKYNRPPPGGGSRVQGTIENMSTPLLANKHVGLYMTRVRHDNITWRIYLVKSSVTVASVTRRTLDTRCHDCP
jgi:hypothetical protein